jgi:hypothetical protein
LRGCWLCPATRVCGATISRLWLTSSILFADLGVCGNSQLDCSPQGAMTMARGGEMEARGCYRGDGLDSRRLQLNHVRRRALFRDFSHSKPSVCGLNCCNDTSYEPGSSRLAPRPVGRMRRPAQAPGRDHSTRSARPARSRQGDPSRPPP